ncbi:MAG: ribosomal protein S12 methylthiotransferase RimO [Lentisphaerae bacterium GWF2_44_16]|nr:MAG: ribosomal protein S12 methylthiotransferase RimO [Lentisphaerae bacterium GWF2_44_16]
MDTEINKYVYIVSLGCSKNFVDTEIMAAALISYNFGISACLDDADIFLINTCAFIPPARKEAETVIEQALKWKKSKKNRDRKVIVSGCIVQWDRKSSFMDKYPEVNLWLGINEVAKLGNHISRLFLNKRQILVHREKPSFLYDELTPRLQLTPDHYAYIKIAEGCDNHCSYCAIPSIRGRLRSRTTQSTVKEAENLLNNGVKELILIAQDITAFGNDTKEADENLASLLKTLDSLKGNFWLRLLYLHPEGITEKLVETLVRAKHIIHYLDIPLQHISDRILSSMNRKIGRQEISDALALLRTKIPDIAIRTTFLTGFPGETEEDFEELCAFVREQSFERLGVFPYYPEKFTPAASMKNQVSPETAEERASFIMRLQAKISLNRNRKLAGKVFDVIVDSVDNKSGTGRTYMDAPEIDNTVSFTCKGGVKAGDFVKVRIKNSSRYDLTGDLM